jgi:7-carboxy-7-deazaguanine synthase
MARGERPASGNKAIDGRDEAAHDRLGRPMGLLAREDGGVMTYAVKEIFYTLQGEGAQAGRPAVFCRFAGCNLWSGREADRDAALCRFCDTDFVGTDGSGGGRFAGADTLAQAVERAWPGGGRPFVVCTGGEPLLQLDDALVAALHARGFEVAIETNGTIAPAPAGLDWICVSPKAGTPLRLTKGDELKLVVPQPGVNLEALEHLHFRRFAVQPMDGPDVVANTRYAVELCLHRPQWQLSLQTHKLLGIR